jgi:hypothetical protein
MKNNEFKKLTESINRLDIQEGGFGSMAIEAIVDLIEDRVEWMMEQGASRDYAFTYVMNDVQAVAEDRHHDETRMQYDDRMTRGEQQPPERTEPELDQQWSPHSGPGDYGDDDY